MYWPDLHKLIDWLTRACDFVLFALTKYFPVAIIVIALIVLATTSGGGLLPGCGGPPLPTPPATVPATATVPPIATPEPTVEPTPEPTPTLPQSPVSPLETPPWQ